jgi:hypothetical protein
MTDEPFIYTPSDDTKFEITLSNVFEPVYGDTVQPFPVIEGVQLETTMALDADEYTQLMGEHSQPLYTVRIDWNLNPHHRAATTWRQRVRRWRDIIAWHWCKLIGRPKVDHVSIEIPECRVVSGP